MLLARALIALVLVAVAHAAVRHAACLSVQEAASHVGKTTCVQGKVVNISQGADGLQYIDFCPEHSKCKFSGAVFAEDLLDVGDIRTLTGKEIEIHGRIRERDGHAQIVVSRSSQIRGPHITLPPVPKEYDVEQRGHFSPGRFRPPKTLKTAAKKKRQPPLPANGFSLPEDPQQ